MKILFKKIIHKLINNRPVLSDNFINIPYSINNLDRYIIRTSILRSLFKSLPNFHGNLLDVGCGKMPYRKYILDNSSVQKYIGLDIETAIDYNGEKPDFLWDGKVMPFNDNSFDTVLLTEVLEHCSYPEIVLSEIFRVLKSDGILFFTIPFLWPLHETPHDQYRYTPWSINKHLQNTNYTEIKIYALGGWHLSMAQMLGLWVNRSPLKILHRTLLKGIAFLIIKKLIKISHREKIDFKESQIDRRDS